MAAYRHEYKHEINKSDFITLSMRLNAALKADEFARADEYLAAHADRCVVKSKSVKAGWVELNMEIRLKSGDTTFINELSALNGVNSAVLVSYNGEYMG